MKKTAYCLLLLLLYSCSKKKEAIKPEKSFITQSVYASGIVKSVNQYQVFANVSGIIESVHVKEGDTVKKGQILFTLNNEAQRLNKENASLSASYNDFDSNLGKLNEAKLFVDLSKSRLSNDSLLVIRQTKLWNQKIGTQIELEQRELAFENSKSTYYSALYKYNELKRQLTFSSNQSKKNLQLSNRLEDDFKITSKIDGIVYFIGKNEGEMVNPQTPLAVVGDARHFLLEMQVDEYDVLKIKKGQKVLLSLDSYKGEVFEALISRINPYMNERSKSFTVEAEFTKKPEVLYPNFTFEANIIQQTKNEAILIPRKYIKDDSIVFKKSGEKIIVKTGLKDYKKIEILSGLSINDELILPEE